MVDENNNLDDMVDVPELELEKYEVPETLDSEVVDETKGSLKFAFLGAGQCGANIVESFYNIGYKKSVVVNTAKHDLALIKIPENQKFLMDIGVSGAGKDPQKGADAVGKHKQEVFDLCRKVYGEKVDHVFVVAGAGGGTGCGSVIPLIEVAKKYMGYIHADRPEKKVGVILTLPTYGEASSPAVARNTIKLLQDLAVLIEQKAFAPLIIIDNDKIHKLYKGLTLDEYWSKINNTVAGLFDIFNRLSAMNSRFTSFDPMDYRSVIEEFGCAIMGVTRVDNYSTEEAVSQAVKNNLSKTLLADGFDLSTAKMAGSIAVCGPNIIKESAGLADNLHYGFDTLSNLCDKATVHRGIYQGPREVVNVYTIVSGMQMPQQRINQLKSKMAPVSAKDPDFKE